MIECEHQWEFTGETDTHVKGGVPDLFKYGLRFKRIVRCAICGQRGFRGATRVVYTWSPQ